MRVSVLAAQIPVGIFIQENLRRIGEVVQEAQQGEWVVFPEGALSGDEPNLSFLAEVDLLELRAAARRQPTLAAEKLIKTQAGPFRMIPVEQPARD